MPINKNASVLSTVMMENCLLLIFLAIPSALSQLPDGWKACNRNAPDYDACFLREFTKASSEYGSGKKTLGGPSIDPLLIQKIHIPKDNSPVNVDLTFTNYKIRGLSNFKVVELKNDWKTMKGVVVFPEVRTLGDYKVDGKVLVVPIVGEGKCNITLYDINLPFEVVWKTVEKGGKKYFQTEKFKIDIGPKKMDIYLANLYKGDKPLGDNTNLFLNENWDKIFNELKPGFNQGIGEALKQITNVLLSKIPADTIDLQ